MPLLLVKKIKSILMVSSQIVAKPRKTPFYPFSAPGNHGLDHRILLESSALYARNSPISTQKNKFRAVQLPSSPPEHEQRRWPIGNASYESVWARMKSEFLYDRYDTETIITDELRTLIWRYGSTNGGLLPLVTHKRDYESLKNAA